MTCNDRKPTRGSAFSFPRRPPPRDRAARRTTGRLRENPRTDSVHADRRPAMTSSSLRRFIAVWLACIAAQAFAQDAVPADITQVTDAQIAQVQDNIEIGCVKRGLQRNAPEPEVRAFCACITDVIRKQVPRDEMLQFVLAAIKDDNSGAEAIFLRHKDAMMACKK